MTRKFFIWILAALLIAGLAGFIFYFQRGKPPLKIKVALSQHIPNHTDNVPRAVENHGMENEATISLATSDVENPLNEEYDEEEREVIQIPLHEAVAQRDILKILALLHTGADVNAQDLEGKTAFYQAVSEYADAVSNQYWREGKYADISGNALEIVFADKFGNFQIEFGNLIIS